MSKASSLTFSVNDASIFSRTRRVLDSGIAEGVAPSMVAGAWSAALPESGLVLTAGQGRCESVFDLSSVSKVFATTPMVALLVERGWLSWDTTFSSIFPLYPFNKIGLHHLLSHTAGFVAWKPFWEDLRQAFLPRPLWQVPVGERQRKMRDLVLAVVPDAAPGEKCVYSDVSFLLIGFMIEELMGMPLDVAVSRWLWEPLRLHSAHYFHVDRSVQSGSLEQVVPTENSAWRGGTLQGQVHDDNCWAMGGYAGHAGAFSDIRDLLKYSRAIFEGLFSYKVKSRMWERQKHPPGCERALGWDTPSEHSMLGTKFSRRSVGHWGFTGTSLWLDLEAEIGVSLLTNRVHPSRDNDRIRAFRPRFHDAIYEDLVDAGLVAKR